MVEAFGVLDVPTRAKVSNGCVLPPNATTPYRVAFDVNDVPTPVTGAPPSRGKLDVTVLVAADAAQSATLFGSSTPCSTAPGSGGILAPGGGVLSQ